MKKCGMIPAIQSFMKYPEFVDYMKEFERIHIQFFL